MEREQLPPAAVEDLVVIVLDQRAEVPIGRIVGLNYSDPLSEFEEDLPQAVTSNQPNGLVAVERKQTLRLTTNERAPQLRRRDAVKRRLNGLRVRIECVAWIAANHAGYGMRRTRGRIISIEVTLRSSYSCP